MVRKLKYHEQKLLKKVDFLSWKNVDNPREISVMRKYHIQDRDDYSRYNRLCGLITKLANRIALLDPNDSFREKTSSLLLKKLSTLGLIDTDRGDLQQAAKVSVSSFCRRRLAVILTKLKMAETLKEAVTFVEQGHVRVGPEIVRDPAFLVNKTLEDYVTWVDSSAIRQKVLKYNDKMDDYDFLTVS